MGEAVPPEARRARAQRGDVVLEARARLRADRSAPDVLLGHLDAESRRDPEHEVEEVDRFRAEIVDERRVRADLRRTAIERLADDRHHSGLKGLSRLGHGVWAKVSPASTTAGPAPDEAMHRTREPKAPLEAMASAAGLPAAAPSPIASASDSRRACGSNPAVRATSVPQTQSTSAADHPLSRRAIPIARDSAHG